MIQSCSSLISMATHRAFNARTRPTCSRTSTMNGMEPCTSGPFKRSCRGSWRSFSRRLAFMPPGWMCFQEHQIHHCGCASQRLNGAKLSYSRRYPPREFQWPTYMLEGIAASILWWGCTSSPHMQQIVCKFDDSAKRRNPNPGDPRESAGSAGLRATPAAAPRRRRHPAWPCGPWP